MNGAGYYPDNSRRASGHVDVFSIMPKARKNGNLQKCLTAETTRFGNFWFLRHVLPSAGSSC